MENIGVGLELMVVGMLTVFVIILIVIYGSRLLILIINRIAPAESVEQKTVATDDTAAVRPVLEAAVARLTGGKGHIVRITKI